MRDQAVREAPIVFTHGLGESAQSWGELVDIVGGHHDVVTWDLRGHGDADKPSSPADYTMESGVQDLLRVIEAAGAPVHLVGHSLGGYLSLVVAWRRPDVVRSLTLIASGPGFRDAGARAEWNRYVDRAVQWMPVPVEAAGLARQTSSEVIDHVSEIEAPLLVIVGERDTRFRASAEFFARAVPGSTARCVAGAGHSVHRTHASEVATLLMDHLGGPRRWS